MKGLLQKNCLIRDSGSDILNQLYQTPNGKIFHTEDGYMTGRRFSHQFLSSLLTDQNICQLTNETPVFIDAPTGCGKTTFAMEHILPLTKQKGKRILILCSRTALKSQYQYDAIKREAPELLEQLTPVGIQKQSSIGVVDIYTYQAFQYQLKQKPLGFFQQYGSVIFDECHFFIYDAAFNEYTREILDDCIKKLHHCLRFYLTATPESCLDEIVKLEKTYSSKILKIGANNCKSQFFLYSIEKDYSYIKPCFFTNDSAIIDIIKEDSSSSKYLVCVDNKELGQKLQKLLGDISEYIDAEGKNNDKADFVDSIIQTETYDKKVLIATSFLDVGVNLTDEHLQKIVIYSTNKTHFIQSIGRKRRLTNETVTLYIKIPDLTYIKKLCGHLKVDLAQMLEYKNQLKTLVRHGLSSFAFPYYISCVNGEYQINYNGFTFTNLSSRITELQNMIRHAETAYSTNEGFAYHYLQWLNLERLYPECHWLGNTPDDMESDMHSFINNYINKELSREMFTQFCAEFLTQYNQLFPHKKLRSDRSPGINKLKRVIAEHNWSYRITTIKNNGTTYRIEKG